MGKVGSKKLYGTYKPKYFHDIGRKVRVSLSLNRISTISRQKVCHCAEAWRLYGTETAEKYDTVEGKNRIFFGGKGRTETTDHATGDPMNTENFKNNKIFLLLILRWTASAIRLFDSKHCVKLKYNFSRFERMQNPFFNTLFSLIVHVCISTLRNHGIKI